MIKTKYLTRRSHFILLCVFIRLLAFYLKPHSNSISSSGGGGVILIVRVLVSDFNPVWSTYVGHFSPPTSVMVTATIIFLALNLMSTISLLLREIMDKTVKIVLRFY